MVGILDFGQIWILLSKLSSPKVQAYTKNHHCSLYSSWEINLNIRVEVRVDTNVDRLMNEMDKEMNGRKT